MLGEIEDTNKRLLKFLDTSTHYKAEKILGHLPLDGMLFLVIMSDEKNSS